MTFHPQEVLEQDEASSQVVDGLDAERGVHEMASCMAAVQQMAVVPEPSVQPAMTVDELVVALGGRLGRTAVYAGCREFMRTGGESGIPAIRAGRKILCPTAAVRRWLAMDTTDVTMVSSGQGQS